MGMNWLYLLAKSKAVSKVIYVASCICLVVAVVGFLRLVYGGFEGMRPVVELSLVGIWTLLVARYAYKHGLDAGFRKSRDLPPQELEGADPYDLLAQMGDMQANMMAKAMGGEEEQDNQSPPRARNNF